jgi:hypothetical protein
MGQSLLEKVFYSYIIPTGQQTQEQSESDACFCQLQSMLSPEAKEKLEQYLTMENSNADRQEAQAFISGCRFAFRFLAECME